MLSTRDAGHRPVIRRRPTQAQGKALEIMGHAIEYLMDSYILYASKASGFEDYQAVKILERLSIEIFNECPEVLPLRIRLRHKLNLL